MVRLVPLQQTPEALDGASAPSTQVRLVPVEQETDAATARTGTGPVAEPDVVADALQQFGEGFNRVLGTLLFAPVGLPVDIARRAGLTETTGQEVAESTQLGRFLFRDTPAQTTAGRVAESAGNIVATDVPLAAATLGAAPVVAAATRGAQRLLPAVVGQQARGIAAAPGRAAAGEAAAATGAGTAIGLARENQATPGEETVAGVAGGLAPGVAAALSPTRLVARGAQAAARRFGAGGRDRAARGEAGEVLRRSLDVVDPAVTREADLLETQVPGLNLSLAERTSSPRLLGQQARLGETLDGQRLTDELARRGANQEAIQRAATDLIDGDASPDRVVEASRRTVQSQLDDLDAQTAGVQGEEEASAAAVRPARPARDVGAQIRTLVTEQRAATKRGLRGIADELGLNDPAARINISNLRRDLLRAFADASGLRRATARTEGETRAIFGPDGQPVSQVTLAATPTQPRALIDVPIMRIIRDLDTNQSVDGLTSLRSLVGEELEIALREARAGNATVRRGLGAARRVLDNFLDDIGNQVADPDLGERMRLFRGLYRRSYIEPFEQGTAHRVLRRSGQRDYKIRDELVGSEFFKPGNEQAAIQYRRIFGDDAAANEAIQDAALDSLADSAVIDGVVNARRLAAWRNRHRSVLDQFPQIRAAVDDIDTAAARLGDRREELRQRRAQAENAIITRELRGVEGGIRSPEEFVARMLSNPERSASLITSLRTPESRAALARTAWDTVQRAPNPIDFLDQNGRALLQAFGGGREGRLRLARARDILQAANRAGQVAPPVGPEVSALPSVDSVENFLNTGLNQISSRIFAVASGRTSTRFIGTELAGRFARGYSRRRADEVLTEALFDPALARRLIEGVTKPPNAERARRLNTFLVAVGLGPDKSEEDQ